VRQRHLLSSTDLSHTFWTELCSGRVLPEGYIQSVAKEVHARGVRLHVDGARLWNAAAATGQRVAEVAAGADSVSVCLSKGVFFPCGVCDVMMRCNYIVLPL